MKNKVHVLAAALAAIALIFTTGCGHRPQTLTIRVFVDGSDQLKISGGKLWFEHQTFQLPGETVYVNGTPWAPQWNGKVSLPFEGVNPAFHPRDVKNIQLSPRTGRGTVTIAEPPSASNDQTLTLAINDDEFDGADWYDIAVTW